VALYSLADAVVLQDFPGLRQARFRTTSPSTDGYNCFAWAMSESHRWWSPIPPIYYWPPNVPREFTLAAFEVAFRTRGFESCTSPELEAGYEKVALYVDANGTPKHAARQLPSGEWTSKLGSSIDIAHTLPGLEGTAYGQVTVYFRRSLVTVQPSAATNQVQGT
jgi:hypothetical protein